MRMKLSHIIFGLLICNVGLASNYEKGQPFEGKRKFDGVWVDHGYVLLVKDLGGEAVLHGKDIYSAWSGRCQVKELEMSCKGKGETEKREVAEGLVGGSTFNFEGSFKLKDGKLHESSRTYGEGFYETQSAVLKKIKLIVPEG